MFLALDCNRAPAAGLHSVLNDGILGPMLASLHQLKKDWFFAPLRPPASLSSKENRPKHESIPTRADRRRFISGCRDFWRLLTFWRSLHATPLGAGAKMTLYKSSIFSNNCPSHFKEEMPLFSLIVTVIWIWPFRDCCLYASKNVSMGALRSELLIASPTCPESCLLLALFHV